jgi:transposase InsO family protein
VLEQGWSVGDAAVAAGCSARTVWKWLARYRAGDEELVDRSSRPRRCPARLGAGRVRAIEALRRLWMTAAEISEVLVIPLSTVSAWLKRIGLGKRSRLVPTEPPCRYERDTPGELVHVDIKRLGRISARGAGHRVLGHVRSKHRLKSRGKQISMTGYEYVHVMIDDHTRLAYAEVLDGLRQEHATSFLHRALAWFNQRGVQIKELMSDNGSCYVSHAYRDTLQRLGIHHQRIKPGRPQTNGKAERFIQTLQNEWAYNQIYGSSHERTRTLPLFLDRYNYTRPHNALGKQPPATRLNNLTRNNT